MPEQTVDNAEYVPAMTKAPEMDKAVARIGETCAVCGQEIGMLDASYYSKDGDEDIGRAYHLRCGIGKSLAAKDEEIQRLHERIAALSLSLSATREEIAQTFYEGMLGKMEELEGVSVRVPWTKEGEEAEKVRECFRAGADAICALPLSASPAAAERKLSEEEQHAIGHAKYLVERASPDAPEVCFDYELVATLLRLIERAIPLSAQPPAAIFECPDCGKDIADTDTPHSPNCQRLNNRRETVVVLKSLTNAVDGLSFREAEIREIVGNTNWNVLRHWIDEARVILAAAPLPEKQEPK